MLLFLDVDGTLLPFGAAGPYPTYDARVDLPAAAVGHPLLSRVDPAPARLHRVDHRRGLTERDFAVVEEWLGTRRDGR
jgi:hypothetical protein